MYSVELYLSAPRKTGVEVLMSLSFQLGLVGFASVEVSAEVHFDFSISNWEIGFDGDPC